MEFFGCYCLLLGYLIFKSRFMPRVLGVFMAIAGLSYQLFLSPPLAKQLFPYVIVPAGALGELSFILWLVVMGVNTQRWKERASSIVDWDLQPLQASFNRSLSRNKSELLVGGQGQDSKEIVGGEVCSHPF
jgi:hypothetical protein